MKRLNISFAAIFSLFLLILFFSLNTLVAQTLKIKIIETSDVHGAILPYDFINDKPADHSLTQVYTYVEEQRRDPCQEIILLDNGDILQGQPIVYYYNFENVDVPHIASEAMNFMGYNAATVGNHDIETGHPVYDRIYEEFNFPWLAANAVYAETGEQYFPPYRILHVNNIKVAVLGLITPYISNWLPEKIWEGIEFEDMIAAAQKWVKIIQEKENPEILIGLFHSGVDYTYGSQTADQPKNENASKLVAERVPGFDVVFVGHDHETWNFTVKNPNGKEVYILGPAGSARNIAVASIEMNFDSSTSTWNKDITGEIIETKNYKPDKSFVEHFSTVFEETKDYVSKPIGTFTKTISTRESMFGDSPFVDLIHTIQLDLTGADVSFAAPLSFDAKIKEGTVYVRDMFNLYKYENLLYTMELTGKEIKDYLEYSYSLWFNQMEDENDHLLNFEQDENGNLIYSERSNSPQLANRYYSFDSAAGIEYTVDVSNHAGERINIISMSNGMPFDINKKYKAAINSYRGTGGGGLLTEGAKIPKEELNERIITSTDKDLRYYMMKWIEKSKTITPKALGNWKVVPEDWWKKGKEKDYSLIYKK